jgi:hypothetical protein
MGAKEFSVGLNDFNQTQLTQIQQAVDDVQEAEVVINDSVADVQALVNELKNTDVAQVSASMFEKGRPMMKSVPNAGSSLTTILTLTGKGVLFTLKNGDSSYSCSVLVVADGITLGANTEDQITLMPTSASNSNAVPVLVPFSASLAVKVASPGTKTYIGYILE